MLRIDPDRLTSPVVVEDLTGSGEEFPHVYGPIDVAAVVEARRRSRTTRRRRRRVSVDVVLVGLAAGGRPPRRRSAACSFARCSSSSAASSATRRSRLAKRSGSSAPVGDRRTHGAARLLVVLAVAEAALLHQLEHVGERPLDALARQPQAHRPHAGRVDQPALAGQRQQLRRRRSCAGRAGRRRAPSVTACTLLAEQGVDQRRLAGAARAEERQRAAAGGERPQRPRAGARPPAGDEHRHAEGDLDELAAAPARVVDEVGLGQHDRRRRRRCRTPARARARAGAGSAAAPNEWDRKTMSMFAASVCASARAPSNDARRTNADRRGSTCSTRSPSSRRTTQSPTATSAPMLRTAALRRGTGQHGAPPAVEPGHAAGPPGAPELLPRRARGRRPSPSERTSPSAAIAGQPATAVL